MNDTIHYLIEQYGLIAVFLGCLAEGETAAILAGFFAHQHVFVPWHAYAVTAVGAFLGDVAFFLAGRQFADHPYVEQLRQKPGFAHAHRLMQAHPALYVLLNRYVYGFRLVGGVAAGLSGIPVALFLVLNAISALVWAALFGGIGYVFGLGAETFIGDELMKHERLLIGAGLGVAAAVAAAYLAHILYRRGVDRDRQ